MSRLIATAAIAILISGTASAAEQSPVEIVSTFNLYSTYCKTPMTDSARALMYKHILTVKTEDVKAANDKLWPSIEKMGVGRWCRDMTKVIAAASHKHEE
jgi:hypothetical protein